MKTYLISGVIALVVALGVLLGAHAISPDESAVALTVMAPDGSILGKTQPIHASSGPPVPACNTTNTVLTCEGVGAPFSWNFPTGLDGGNIINQVQVKQTTTLGADGGPLPGVVSFPIAPFGITPSAYTGVCSLNLFIGVNQTQNGVFQDFFCGGGSFITLYNEAGTLNPGVTSTTGSSNYGITYFPADAAAPLCVGLTGYTDAGGYFQVKLPAPTATASSLTCDAGCVDNFTTTYTITCQ